MEEDRSSAHHFRIFPRQKKLLCTWSEMYILCFHFVGQLCCYYRVDMLLPLGSRKVRLLIVTAYLLLLIISAVKAKGGKKVCLTYVCQKHQVQCYFQFLFQHWLPPTNSHCAVMSSGETSRATTGTIQSMYNKLFSFFFFLKLSPLKKKKVALAKPQAVIS